VYTRREGAHLLKISLPTLDRLRPQLEPVCVSHGKYFYRRQDILNYLRSLGPAPMRMLRSIAVRRARKAATATCVC
jgi:hypothetical protein